MRAGLKFPLRDENFSPLLKIVTATFNGLVPSFPPAVAAVLKTLWSSVNSARAVWATSRKSLRTSVNRMRDEAREKVLQK